jgi:dinuclear metal center YbgI/SA1388 family protein
MTISEILKTLHAWIPTGTAQGYDNVGLQVGDPRAEVTRGLVALDLTPDVVQEAIDSKIDLIVTHHPLLFKGLKRVDATDLVGSMVLRLAEHRIALAAAHTNLDASAEGVSARLAATIGLQDVEFLEPLHGDLVKLVTYAPVDHAEAIRTAITGATDQTIGPYRDVAFESPGEGFFRPLPEATPYIGEAGGDIERVEERRIELTLDRQNLAASIAALKKAHPYQTVVYDVFEIGLPSDEFGLGAIGRLTEPGRLSDFLDRVCTRLSVPALRYTGRLDQMISTVAVCGGAGRDLIGSAMRGGADVFVTSDLTYHSFFEVLDHSGKATMALVDAGHYETEAAAEALLVEWLSSSIPDVAWSRTSLRTSPIRFHVTQEAPE